MAAKARALEEGRERALTSFQQECSSFKYSSEGGTERGGRGRAAPEEGARLSQVCLRSIEPLEDERFARDSDLLVARLHNKLERDPLQKQICYPQNWYLRLCEKMKGTDPLSTPVSQGVTGDFVGIGTRTAHARGGYIQCLKHRLWRSVRMK